jgi:hypothetical protein
VQCKTGCMTNKENCYDCIITSVNYTKMSVKKEDDYEV